MEWGMADLNQILQAQTKQLKDKLYCFSQPWVPIEFSCEFKHSFFEYVFSSR